MPGNKNTLLALNKQSIAIIRSNKKLLVFPIINYILTISLLLIAMRSLVKIEAAAWQTRHVDTKTYLVFFSIIIAYFFLFHLINTLFTAALMQCALKHIEKKSYTLRTGFRTMFKNAIPLILWKIIMTTIGPVIRFIEYWEDDWSKTSKIATNLLSTLPWMSATIIIIPVLISENLGPIRSIKRSAQLILEHWGEKAYFQSRISFTLGLIRILAFLPLIIALFIGGKIDLITASAISMILFLSVSIIHAASQIILISALYLYAINRNTSAYFDVDLLRNAL